MQVKPLIAFATLTLVAGTYIYSQDEAKAKITTKEIAALKGSPKYAFAKISSEMLSWVPDKEKQEHLERAMLLGDAMREIAASGQEASSFSASQLREFLGSRGTAKSAAQVSQLSDEAGIELQALIVAQNAEMIEQNKRMIKLLETIAVKK